MGGRERPVAGVGRVTVPCRSGGAIWLSGFQDVGLFGLACVRAELGVEVRGVGVDVVSWDGRGGRME